MRRLRVGYDLDGPGYRLLEAVKQFRHKRLGVPLGSMPLPLPAGSSVAEVWGVTLPELVSCINQGVNAGYIFRRGDPADGFVRSVRDVYDAGHTVHIVTSRAFGAPGLAEKHTREWLGEHGVPFHSLTFATDKTCLRPDLMVADRLGTYEALDAAGCQSWLLNRLWNQPWDDDRRRVETLAEFTEKVDAAAAGAAA